MQVLFLSALVLIVLGGPLPSIAQSAPEQLFVEHSFPDTLSNTLLRYNTSKADVIFVGEVESIDYTSDTRGGAAQIVFQVNEQIYSAIPPGEYFEVELSAANVPGILRYDGVPVPTEIDEGDVFLVIARYNSESRGFRTDPYSFFSHVSGNNYGLPAGYTVEANNVHAFVKRIVSEHTRAWIFENAAFLVAGGFVQYSHERGTPFIFEIESCLRGDAPVGPLEISWDPDSEFDVPYRYYGGEVKQRHVLALSRVDGEYYVIGNAHGCFLLNEDRSLYAVSGLPFAVE